MPRALVLAPFDHRELEVLRTRVEAVYESWLDTGLIHDPSELGTRLNAENFDILVVESDFVFDELFENAPCLRFVGICRAGLNHVDLDAARERGVSVVNTPGRTAQAVAEHALALMFALARQIPIADRYVKSGGWSSPASAYKDMRGVELAGRTLGIIGYGAIGRTLSALAACIGMRVLAFDPYAAGTTDATTMVPLDELLRTSDFVSLHVPVTPETEGMIGPSQIALLKPGAFLVSCSDPSVVDENALVAALRSGHIAGGAFDVFDTHPIRPDSLFLTLENVLLTPHIAGATDGTIQRHSRMMVSDIFRWLDGERPLNLVNPEVWHERG
jgi:phosphoglycerate dehydrogenase-like enzyme